jgi:predicted ATPase
VQPSGVRGRLEAVAASRGLTPFVGREDELRLLMNRWERNLDGEGQVVLVVGEAGIGKSRLVRQFLELLTGAPPHTWIECAADPFTQTTPFYAVADMLHHSLGLSSEAGPEERAKMLGHSVATAGLKPEQAVL